MDEINEKELASTKDVRDELVTLLTWCRERGVSFDTLLFQARRTVNRETAEEEYSRTHCHKCCWRIGTGNNRYLFEGHVYCSRACIKELQNGV